MLQKDEDIEGCGNGVSILPEGGSMIRFDKEVG